MSRKLILFDSNLIARPASLSIRIQSIKPGAEQFLYARSSTSDYSFRDQVDQWALPVSTIAKSKVSHQNPLHAVRSVFLVFGTTDLI